MEDTKTGEPFLPCVSGAELSELLLTQTFAKRERERERFWILLKKLENYNRTCGLPTTKIHNTGEIFILL